jgi:hypothetical protein
MDEAPSITISLSSHRQIQVKFQDGSETSAFSNRQQRT